MFEWLINKAFRIPIPKRMMKEPEIEKPKQFEIMGNKFNTIITDKLPEGYFGLVTGKEAVVTNGINTIHFKEDGTAVVEHYGNVVMQTKKITLERFLQYVKEEEKCAKDNQEDPTL